MCIVYVVQCTLSTFMLYTHCIPKYTILSLRTMQCIDYIFIQDSLYTIHICCVKCIRYKYIYSRCVEEDHTTYRDDRPFL